MLNFDSSDQQLKFRIICSMTCILLMQTAGQREEEEAVLIWSDIFICGATPDYGSR